MQKHPSIKPLHNVWLNSNLWLRVEQLGRAFYQKDPKPNPIQDGSIYTIPCKALFKSITS